MPPSILITGGAGFIGCALAGRLIEIGVSVTVLDVLHPQVHDASDRPPRLPAAARLVVGDVTDPAAVTEALRTARPDTVVHLAAETGTGQSLRAASRHGLVNVVGTTRLLDGMSQLAEPPRHIVLASSRAVYGEGQWIDDGGIVFAPGGRRHDDLEAGRWDPRGPSGRPATALPHRAGITPTEPASVYAATKLAQEHLLSAWCGSTNTALSVLRLQNVYGPGQSLTNEYAGVLARFARQAVAGETIEVFEDGAIRRDFVYVDDATAALAAAVLHPPVGRRLLDIGLGRSTTMLAAARAVAATADAPVPVVSGRFRDGDVRAASCDIAAAVDELRYRPIWSLERGLAALGLGRPPPAAHVQRPPTMVTTGPYHRLLDAAEVGDGAHRRMVGGMWDAVGRLQFEHLVANGLTAEMRLLDIGCGALRGGVHFVRYLAPGGYYGLDLNASLLDAGYDVELAALGLQDKLPRQQLIADAAFDLGRFGVTFDMALAHSVFTHLPASDVRRCLIEVAAVLVPGGRLFATFYECPPDRDIGQPVRQRPGDITTFADRNPFHYTAPALVACAADLPLRVRGWGPWNHPRAQRMMTIERVRS